MPKHFRYKNEYDRPLVIWVVQIFILISCIAIVAAVFKSAQICLITEPFFMEDVDNCWAQILLPQIWPQLIALGIWLGLFYGLEKGMPYVRWLVAILFIAAATMAIGDTHYLQLALTALLPGKTIPTPPYELLKQQIPLGNVSLAYSYGSYSELARKIFLEIIPIAFMAFPGIWLITSRAAKRYLS